MSAFSSTSTTAANSCAAFFANRLASGLSPVAAVPVVPRTGAAASLLHFASSACAWAYFSASERTGFAGGTGAFKILGARDGAPARLGFHAGKFNVR